MTSLTVDKEVFVTVTVEIEDIIDDIPDDVLLQEFRRRGMQGEDPFWRIAREWKFFGDSAALRELERELVDRGYIGAFESWRKQA